ncbi:uncharacterized protein F5147DRAFT_768024 [Suillus discolor]|uniref:Uncharacterized protein n=1 Tax=Suillus discolor TaxID=1912936 RepID=A0A9P7FIY1_9AGAM|nr:uncharacterized protein F5147DRAFT_768024 [Suillus discolor]KAG2117885.1 hypothetical protein F5147DRAFT_768024 [Suillus discolor]
MSFSFDNIVTPQGEKLQCIFADLRVPMASLSDSIPEDCAELIMEKEEWCHSWECIMRNLDQCSINGKTFGLLFPLSPEEAGKGHCSSKAYDHFRAQLCTFRAEAEHQASKCTEEEHHRKETLARDEDVRMSAGTDDKHTAEDDGPAKDGSGENKAEEEEEGDEEEEEKEHPKQCFAQEGHGSAQTEDPVDKHRSHACHPQGQIMVCQNCKATWQGCKHSTRKGKGCAIKPLLQPKACTASTVESMPMPGPSKEVLIRRLRDTVEVLDEEEVTDTRKATGKKRSLREGMEPLGDVEDVDLEDLETEALTRSIYAQMATIQAMMGKVMNVVDLLSVCNKKHRRHQ